MARVWSIGEAEEDYGVQSTECGKIAVQRCKSAYGLCKGGKVGPEYRVRSTDYGGMVGAWLRRVLRV